MGVTEQTFYRLRRKYQGVGVSELRRLRQLEEENSKLKRLVADLTLDKHMLQEGDQKKALKPAQKRMLAEFLMTGFRVSRRRACGLVLLNRPTRPESRLATAPSTSYFSAKAGRSTKSGSTASTSSGALPAPYPASQAPVRYADCA